MLSSPRHPFFHSKALEFDYVCFGSLIGITLARDQIYIPFADKISYQRYFKLLISWPFADQNDQHFLKRKLNALDFSYIMSVNSLFVEQLMYLGLVDSLNW